MITHKFITSIPEELDNYFNQFNNIVRFAYNRNNRSLSETEKLVKSKMNNIDLMDASFIKMAVNKAKSISHDKKVIFGGKVLFNKRKKSIISKEEYKNNRNQSIILRGSGNDKGNRKVKLDIENNQIIFKPSKSIHIPIKLPHISKKIKDDLLLLQEKCSNYEACFTLTISRDSISISYDENYVKENYPTYTPKENRILSIDLNPNYIAVVIAENNNILHKEIIDLKDINNLNIKSNKRNYELIEISKYIMGMCSHWHCHLAIEKLSMTPKNHGKGKYYNRIVNGWNRNLLIGNLKKRCILNKIKFLEINPAYSSFIGQMLNPNEYDSIAAAIEINRRAMLLIQDIKYKVLPDIFDLSQLPNRWKKEVIVNGIKDWYGLYNLIKKMKSSYRFLFTRNLSSNSFRLFSYKSSILLHLIT